MMQPGLICAAMLPDVPADTAAPAANAAGARIFVVDDHALSRKHLRTVLTFHGHAVESFDSAAAARPALLAAPPALVLMDLQMPGEDGYGLLAWMRQQPSLAQLPVICVTASVPVSERERVRAAGFAAFVPKPITPPQRLLDAVAAALSGRTQP